MSAEYGAIAVLAVLAFVLGHQRHRYSRRARALVANRRLRQQGFVLRRRRRMNTHDVEQARHAWVEQLAPRDAQPGQNRR